MLHRYAFATALMSLIGGTVMAAEAGRVVFVTGKADIGRHAAAQNAIVEEGDQLSTGADGYIYVRTVDDGFLILRPNSNARIVAYVIDKQDPSRTQVKLELTQGVARTISGQGVKQARQNFRFNTPVAAIGVRGTDFTVYTDQQTTRVAVLSGGVIMSGFSASCLAAGTGPCEGRGARELFAGQSGLLLQIERGGQVPQLMQNPALMPDQEEKPRSDEPAVKPITPAAPIAQINLDPARSDSLNNVRPTPLPVPNPVVTTPPVVVIEPARPVEPERPVALAKPEIIWGRWQTVAGAPEVNGRIEGPDMDIPFYYSPYAIARVKNSSLVMPAEGTAAFRLQGGEAVMSNSEFETIADIESGNLNMDFGKRTFNTNLVVVGGGERATVVGSGVISDKGMLYEDSRSDTVIRGFLGGAQAEQAGYIFKNSLNPRLTISGATLWGR